MTRDGSVRSVRGPVPSDRCGAPSFLGPAQDAPPQVPARRGTGEDGQAWRDRPAAGAGGDASGGRRGIGRCSGGVPPRARNWHLVYLWGGRWAISAVGRRRDYHAERPATAAGRLPRWQPGLPVRAVRRCLTVRPVSQGGRLPSMGSVRDVCDEAFAGGLEPVAPRRLAASAPLRRAILRASTGAGSCAGTARVAVSRFVESRQDPSRRPSALA